MLRKLRKLMLSSVIAVSLVVIGGSVFETGSAAEEGGGSWCARCTYDPVTGEPICTGGSKIGAVECEQCPFTDCAVV